MIGPSRIVASLILVGVWCALWGDVSAANVLSGLALVALITVSRTGPGGRGELRLLPLVRFLALAFVDLVESTGAVARQVVTAGRPTDEAVVAVSVAPVSKAQLLMLTVAVTVTPGTAVVDIDADTGTLYLHILDHRRTEATVRHVERLAESAREALPDHYGRSSDAEEVAS
jgi:multicomponent Na+:H+ antiporter subunit E